MTTALRITATIFLALAGSLYHFNQNILSLIFTALGILILLASLFTHRKETAKDEKALSHKSNDISANHTYMAPSIKIERQNFSFEYFAKNPLTGLQVKVRVKINYPQITGHVDSRIEHKINELLKRTAGFYADHKNEMYNHSTDFTIIALEYDTLALEFEDGGAYLGAATGVTYNKNLNINLKNGEIYELKDIFRSSYREMLLPIVRKNAVCKQTGATPDNPDIHDDHEFYVKGHTLTLVYQRREICAGADGPTYVPIDLDEVKSIINPNGPLSYLL